MAGREPGREWLEGGQAFCAKLGSLNFISKATGSYGSQGRTGLVVGGRCGSDHGEKSLVSDPSREER